MWLGHLMHTKTSQTKAHLMLYEAKTGWQPLGIGTWDHWIDCPPELQSIGNHNPRLCTQERIRTGGLSKSV